MAMSQKKVLVVGGGIGGLTAALALARAGLTVDLVERAPAPGGHAAQLACKAVEACVKCGACTVEEALAAVVGHADIHLHTGCCLDRVERRDRFEWTLVKTDGKGAGGPAGAADAVVLATGFQLFDPAIKPYGYGRYPGVITSLEFERRLRNEGPRLQAKEGGLPLRLAFIQCVGSRDVNLGHPWCSAYCCGAALRAARLVQTRQPAAGVTIFFIDIQTFGRDFESVYRDARRDFRFVRSIPAEAATVEGGGLRLSWVDDETGGYREEVFDLVVLSAGMTPSPETGRIAGLLGLPLASSGFIDAPGSGPANGVFAAGAARGPMTIAETVADARAAARQVIAFLAESDEPPACREAAARPPAG
jgi:heterodisulfide reductase subunit A